MSAIPKHIQLPVSNKKVQTIGPSLLQQLKLEIRHEGQEVILKIGNSELRMDYPGAAKLSAMVRMHAKQAKKFAGDFSKDLHTEAVLTDAEMNYKHGWGR